MGTIEFAYDVTAAPDLVFAALTDFSRLTNWRSLESMRLEPDGPLQVGSRIFTTVKGPVGTMHFANEVTELDPAARRYNDRWLDGTFVIESGWQVVAKGSGTQIHWTTRYAPRGFFWLLAPMLGRIIQQGQEKDLGTFAAQLTSG